MSLGAGKYDELCEHVRMISEADGIVMLVLRGIQGSGVSVKTKDELLLASLPALLRHTADLIEAQVAEDFQRIVEARAKEI